jgi:hypothetical protein
MITILACSRTYILLIFLPAFRRPILQAHILLLFLPASVFLSLKDISSWFSFLPSVLACFKKILFVFLPALRPLLLEGHILLVFLPAFRSRLLQENSLGLPSCLPSFTA